MVVFVLSLLAHAAEPGCDPVPAVGRALDGTTELMLAEADAQFQAAIQAFGCSAKADPAVVSTLFAVRGARLRFDDQRDPGLRWYAASRALPGASFPEVLGEPERAAWSGAKAAGATKLEIPGLPAGSLVWIDGAEADLGALSAGPHLVQLAPAGGTIAVHAAVVDLSEGPAKLALPTEVLPRLTPEKGGKARPQVARPPTTGQREIELEGVVFGGYLLGTGTVFSQEGVKSWQWSDLSSGGVTAKGWLTITGAEWPIRVGAGGEVGTLLMKCDNGMFSNWALGGSCGSVVNSLSLLVETRFERGSERSFFPVLGLSGGQRWTNITHNPGLGYGVERWQLAGLELGGHLGLQFRSTESVRIGPYAAMYVNLPGTLTRWSDGVRDESLNIRTWAEPVPTGRAEAGVRVRFGARQ